MKKLELLVIVFALVGCGHTAVGGRGTKSKPTFADTAVANAATESGVPQQSIQVLRSAEYTGGALYVLDVGGTQVSYECMGTICQKACTYAPVASSFTGPGETAGTFSELAKKRAAAEFGCEPAQVAQVRHSDSPGGGLYVVHACGNEVKYNCMGTVCNLSCN